MAQKYVNRSDSVPMSRFGDFVRQSLQLNETWWVAANLDQRYEAGDQQLWNQYYNAWQVRSNKQFTFNLIRSQVATFEGYQRAHRKSTIAIPRENGSQQTADDYTEIFLWLNQQEKFYETLSSAFRGSLITGMNVIQTWMDYRRDPINGDIKFTNCPYNSIIVDPYFTRYDFSDCQGIVKRSFVTPLEAASYLPEHRDDILGMDGFGPSEATFQFMPQNYQFAYNNLLTYDEFYYPAMRMQKLMVDTKTGETAEWRTDNDDALREFLRAYPEIKLVTQEIPTVRLTIIVQGKVLYDDMQPSGIDCYPFTPILTYYNPELEDFTLRTAGIVRNLRDAQFLFNHRKVLELQSVEAVLNAGWIAEEDAVVNVEDLYKPQPGGVIFTKRGKLQMIQKVMPTPIDPTWMAASADVQDLMLKITNVSETFMGQSTDAISGFHESMKTANSIVANQRLYDQLDTSQEVIGNIVIQMIQNNWTPGKVQRILKRTPTKEFYDKTFGRYDCQVTLGFDTPTQKQMAFMQLLELSKIIPIPPSALLENATIQKKDELLKKMDADAQAQQQQQQRAQELEMLKLQAEIKMAEARAAADTGLAMERESEVDANEGRAIERRAEAIKDQQQGMLDQVKAMKEIEGVTIENFMKFLAFTKTVREMQVEQAIQETEQTANLGESNGQQEENPQANNAPIGRGQAQEGSSSAFEGGYENL